MWNGSAFGSIKETNVLQRSSLKAWCALIIGVLSKEQGLQVENSEFSGCYMDNLLETNDRRVELKKVYSAIVHKSAFRHEKKELRRRLPQAIQAIF